MPTDRLPLTVAAVPTGLTGSRYPWLLVSIQIFLFVSAFVLLWPTTESLITAWEDTDNATYTHGYLIVGISCWLLLRNRTQWQDLTVRPSVSASLLLAVISLVWLVCVRAGIQSAHEVLLPAMIGLLVWAVFGARIASRSFFAIGYLYFAIPVWGVVNDALQWATVVAVELLLGLSGVPAYVDGNLVHLASGVFEIAGGCSGLHFFIVALALAALYGEVHRDGLAVRLRLLALAFGLALITNWVRVYTIIVAGYLTDMQHYLVRVEHYRFGWVVFALMMTVFLLFARRIPARDYESLHGVKVVVSADPEPASWSGPLLRILVLSLMALSIGPLWNSFAPVVPAPLPTRVTVLPHSAGSWQDVGNVDASHWKPVFTGADIERRVQYMNGSSRVEGFTAIYASQAQGKELVGYDNSLLGGDSTIVARSRIKPRGPATELVVQGPSRDQSVLWYFYRVDTVQTGSALMAQLLYGTTSLTTNPLSHIVALRAPCAPDCHAARANLGSFIRAVDL